MSTLAEIETAADSLSSEEKEKLFRFLAVRLGKAGRATTTDRLTGHGKASEWLRMARGSVRLAVGESADDVRMSYYATKYGLTR